VEAFIQAEIYDDFHEARGTQDVAYGKDPSQVVDVQSILGEPHIQGGCEHENRHLDRKEVGLEQAMAEVEDTLPVRSVEVVDYGVREDATVRASLKIPGDRVMVRNIRIGRITARKENISWLSIKKEKECRGENDKRKQKKDSEKGCQGERKEKSKHQAAVA
jgi:hypothetical protein